ncbi:Hypothetical predicted protein, partial [Mytilus galloprovincialis]
MHRYSSQVNLAEEESSPSRNDSHNEDGYHQECFECEYCDIKIEITNQDKDEVAFYEEHFREKAVSEHSRTGNADPYKAPDIMSPQKHIDLLQGGHEDILMDLTDSIRYETEFPDLEAAAKVKGKQVENKQHAGTSSLNDNNTQSLLNVKYSGGDMNLEHHRFPEFFPNERKELLNVVVSSFVSSFLSQE